jgi:hypothetical protein
MHVPHELLVNVTGEHLSRLSASVSLSKNWLKRFIMSLAALVVLLQKSYLYYTPNTSFFTMKRKFSIFCTPENSPFHVRKTRPHRRQTLSVDQLLHHAQTKETNHKNLFLQLDHFSEKHELLLSYMVTVLTIFVPNCADVL